MTQKYTYRSEDLPFFRRRVELNQSCLVLGLPGFGISSFFRVVYQELKSPNVKTVLVDLNMITKPTVDDFFDFLFLSLKNEETYISKNHKFEENFRDITQYFLDTTKDNKQTIFIIDRFEKVCEQFPKEIFDAIRYIAKNSKRKIMFIFGINREITDLRTLKDLDQFYSLIQQSTYFLKPLNQNDSIEYINRACLEYGIKINQTDKLKIFHLTGGCIRMLKNYMIYLSDNSKNISHQIEKFASDYSLVYNSESIFNHLNPKLQEYLIKNTKKILQVNQEESIAKLKLLGILNENNEVFSEIFENYLNYKAISNSIEIELNEKTGEILQNNKKIDNLLSANEYKLLKFFCENSYQIIDREAVAAAVWDSSTTEGVSDEAIDQLISRLRDKIESNKNIPKHIITLRGRGFQFLP